MKRIYIYLTVMATLLIGGGKAMAQSVTIDKITYTIFGDDAHVTAADASIVTAQILSTVTFNGIEYPVTVIGQKAFYYCKNLTTLSIPEVVMSIENGAFYGCSKLTNVSLHENIGFIGSNAFQYCSSLTSIVIPGGVTSISTQTFSDCTSLVNVSIPKSVTLIGGSAFYNCTSLTSIIIPESVVEIGYSAFERCSKLSSISISDNCIFVGGYAFANTAWYNSLPQGPVYIGKVLYAYKGAVPENTTVDIKDGIVSISDYAFLDCASLTSINIPGSVVEIGSHAFENCTSLKAVEIPESVTTIEGGAFSGCSSLSSIVTSSNLRTVGANAFDNTAWYNDQSDGVVYLNHVLYGYKGTMPVKTTIVLREGTTVIATSAFRDCTNLTSVTIPEGVTVIPTYAFHSCTSLNSVSLPQGLMKIELAAFAGCSSLPTIILPPKMIELGASAFNGCSSLTSIVVPEGVNTLNVSVFKGCSSLTSVTLPVNIKSIKSEAFYGCSSLTAIGLSDDLISIGESAFYNCSNLASVTIPQNVTSIGESAFYGCSALTSITIPKKVELIDSQTFKGCSSLVSVLIEDGVLSIGESAFEGCSAFKSLEIPNSVIEVGKKAFYQCRALETVVINEGITVISESMFDGCNSLKSIVFPESLTAINQSAFNYCTALDSVIIPKNVLSIGGNAFYNNSALHIIFNCSDLNIKKGSTDYGRIALNAQKVINVDTIIDGFWFDTDAYGKHHLTYYEGTDSVVTLPSDYQGENYGIDGTVFSGNEQIVSIQLPKAVESIEDGAFYGCSSLTSINILSEITSIGESTFAQCSSLLSFSIPEGVTSIGNNAFDGCSSLLSISLPATVTSIGSSAFANCSSLTSLTLPESVTSIGNQAFYLCTSLASINIPSGVPTIGESTFYQCSSLTSMTLPASVTSIGNQAFYHCGELSTLTLSKKLTSIGTQAFQYCNKLQKIINYSDLQFTKGYTGYGYVAAYAQQIINLDEIVDDYYYFDTDSNGKHHLVYYEGTDSVVALPSDYQGGSYGIDDAVFSGHSEIVSIQLPDEVESIGANTFNGCSSLNSLTIPDSVSSIGASAFNGCSSLTSVNIPSGVPSIGDNTFYGCSALTSLTLPESVTSIGSSAFYNCSSLTSVNIPSGVPSIGANTFYGCSSLMSLTIPANVASIGNYAFVGCKGLKELTIADGGTTLSLGHNNTNYGGQFTECMLEKLYLGRNVTSNYGHSPFNGITTLKEVVIGDSVTVLEQYTFYNCSSLNSIVLSENLTSIGQEIFYNCTSLSSVDLPETLNSIGVSAFRGCSSLTSINIPSRVPTIGSHTFYGCSSLTSMTIPASVTSMDDNSFYGCTSLKELVLVDGNEILSMGRNGNATGAGYNNYGLFNCSSLEKLYLGRNLSFSTNGNYVPFKDQTALTEVVVGDSVTSIYARTFYGCSALNSLSIPETVSSIGTDAFYGCTALTYLYCGFESPQVLVGSSPRAKAVIYVPEGTYVGYKEQFPNNIIVEGEGNEVTVDITLPGTLAEEVLNRVPYIRNVNSLKVSGTLNDNDIATINESMVNLLHLDMSKLNRTSVSGIGHANLCSIVFPDSCKSISGYRDRDNLTSIILPDAVTTLGSECFYNCDQLAEVTMSANLKTVGSNAFYNCDKLKEITFKDGLTSIGDRAFYDCGSLTSVSLGDGIAVIGAEAFYNCSNLRTLVIGDGITSGPHYAFRACSKLSEIHIPDIEAWLNSSFSGYSLENIPNYVSSNVHLYIDGELLTDVVIPSTVTSIRDYAFYQIKGINSVTISDGVTSIGEHAFNGCYDLSSVTIAEGVHTIQGNAFANCDSLRSVTLPSTLRSCAAGAFSGSGLTEVTCPAFFPPVTGGDMIGANNCTLYVPEWTLNRYKLANNWNLFAAIEPISGIYPNSISVFTEEALAIPAEGLAEDYKPNMEIVRYDGSNVGRLTMRGEKAMPLSTFKMEQTRDAGTMTSLVNYGSLTADSVVTEVSFSTNTWHYLTFPYDVKISDIATLGDWVIRRYDGASRARADFSSTWQNVPYDSILHAGEGYIWYSTNGNFTVPAIKNDNRNLIFANDARYTQLKEHASATQANYGWNLIGNPYPCFYDTRFIEYGSPITVRSGNSYQAYSPVDDSYILSPLEAFFVQCSADNNIVGFEPEGRQTDNTPRALTSAPKRTRAVSSDRSVFNLYLENGSYADHTRFVINESASLAYEIACDAAKFMSDDPAVQQLFTIEGEERMAINERPFANGEVALGTYFGKSGNYTIALDTRVTEMEVVLVDKFTGAETDLMTDSYTFTTEAGTFTDRFAIRMKRTGVVDAIEAAAAAKVQVTALSGAISIMNAATPVSIYNAAGALVTTMDGGDVTVEVAPGMYIVKVGDEIHKVSVIK